VDGGSVIVADEAECAVGQKPCYVTSTGKAYGSAIRARTGRSTANVRRILRDLRGDHFIAVNGGQGRPTTYRRVAEERHSSAGRTRSARTRGVRTAGLIERDG